MEYIVEAKELRKVYDSFVAVDEVSFRVKRGEIFGFLGPNGAGKSTTINMLVGMCHVTSGSVVYNGRDLTKNIKKAQRKIGIVADESNLYDELTGFENLCFCGALYGMKKNDRIQKAHELLELFSLKEAANKKFRAYSKGMKRKLTIAAAIIHHPEIIFMDEPTTGIDVVSVRQIRGLIKDLNKNGITIFLTTHYIEEAERLCDRIAFINKGRIECVETVAELLKDAGGESTIEVAYESQGTDKDNIIEKLHINFPGIICTLKGENTIKIVSKEQLDIAPIVSCISAEKIKIVEAKIIKPSLEEVFVKRTGIEAEIMKKEKEKK